ncbi:MAG: Pr6Pr family membrane protein [Microbacterium sp.]|uniref:Pr6Pr family membrane protein n=1 Tax=Microbacterium sp. TaxID=51671 RepID=UPI001ACA5C19|nr:Pr6Pr family membrane protein [Microbacterium sp.]MBN9176822.1 Pr6Pr family membrane protein [Microbacterium sp.]
MNPRLWSLLRLAVAALIVAAIVAQLIRSTTNSIEKGWPVAPTIIDFFSFFTILSNALAVVVLLIGGILMLRGTGGEGAAGKSAVESRGFATVLVCVSTYMIITGIVYNLLLRNIPLPQGATVPWSNEILHVWAPIFLLLDVLLAPRRRALGWSALGAVVVFPLVWLAYTLIRGPLLHDFRTGNAWWYPYPFLNPNVQPWGYGGVALYSIGIAIAIVAVGAFTVWVGRRRGIPVDEASTTAAAV